MKVYIVYDYVSGYHATFDSEEKMIDFIIKEKIQWLKNLGENYNKGEDYSIYITEMNAGWDGLKRK
jgi:hypothetical protein